MRWIGYVRTRSTLYPFDAQHKNVLNKFDRNGRAEGASFGHKDEELATNLCSVVSIAIKSATSEAHAHGAVELAAKTTHAGDDTGYATTHR